MSALLLGREPSPTRSAVRAFFGNPGMRIKYDCLQELRPAMVEDDKSILSALAKRNARDIAIRGELTAADVQLEPSFLAIAAVHRIADERHPYEAGLHDLLDAVYPVITGNDSSIQLYDYPIVSGIAARLNKSKQAIVFKVDRAEGLAPQTQASNIRRAVSIAESILPGNQVFVDQVERMYQILVPATVAIQQTMFDRTYLLGDWDGIGFTGLDLSA